MKFQVVHRFRSSARRYWHATDTDSCNAAIDRATSITRELLEETKRPGRRWQKVRSVPDRRLPAIVAGAIGSDRLVLIQEQDYDDQRLILKFKATPEARKVAGRVRCEGTLTVRDRGDGTCERVVKGEISVAIPLVGRKIEKQVVDQLVDGYNRNAQAISSWLAAHPE
jgi:hypothetical protein